MKQFLQYLKESIEQDNFVRLTLSKNEIKNADLKKVIIKLAIIRKQRHLSFVYREKTKDITTNYLLENGYKEIQELLANTFAIANLFTTQKDVTLEINKQGTAKVKTRKPSFSSIPKRQHDKQKKKHILSPDYLVALGILNEKGIVQKNKGDKYRQINKFIEIIDGLLKKQSQLLKQKKITVVDMGAGKGYLTFALYDYLVNKLQLNAEIIGVEVREDMVQLCNKIAGNVQFTNLSFKLGYISNYELEDTDILIALHACDTATDDAIYKGIKANAQLIVCAPCCHKQIRKQINNKKSLGSILNYGILKERQSEIVTDTLRALLLEKENYKTKVFEFVSTEHTQKNVLIVGQKKQQINSEKELENWNQKITDLKNTFEIEAHYLEGLLSKN